MNQSRTYTDVHIDRPHKFSEGDVVHHLSCNCDVEIVECTYRVKVHTVGSQVAYPTYTMDIDGEPVPDVPCTHELVEVRVNA